MLSDMGAEKYINCVTGSTLFQFHVSTNVFNKRSDDKPSSYFVL